MKTRNGTNGGDTGTQCGEKASQVLPEGFAIMIPTWNNLPFLRLCVRSIKEHSAFNHQIIIHVNDGSDGTLEWVKREGLDFTYSAQNIGVCMAMNTMRRMVKRDYIYFVNDDMYLLPGWDTVLMAEVRSLPDNMFYLSSTMIQPHHSTDVGLCINYGDSIETFDEQRLLNEYQQQPYPDWHGATRPPTLVHRDVWDLVGGYSIELSPGMYSDPDFTAKLLMAGVRHLKGLGRSRVYHFETKTTTRIMKNDGAVQFLLKWGLSNSAMRTFITRQGVDWDIQPEARGAKMFRRKVRWMRLKGLYYMALKGFGILFDFKCLLPSDTE